MAENSKIQWTTHTFNPWRGCSRVAPGCANCYADRQSRRNPKTLGIWGPDGTRVVASEDMWGQPLKWNARAACSCGGGFREKHSPYCQQANRPRVFCTSLADVFEEWTGRMVTSRGADLLVCDVCGAWHEDTDVSASGTCKCGRPLIRMDWATMGDVRGRLFRLIDQTPNLDWLLLTKRPENIRRMVPCRWDTDGDGDCSVCHRGGTICKRRGNLWLGTSVACQDDAEKNVTALLGCRDLAPVLFVSVEPLIESVNLRRFFAHSIRCASYCGSERGFDESVRACDCGRPRIKWVIVGGESGPKARECNVEWIRDIVRQCRDAGVPCFVKQLGAFPIDSSADGVDAADVGAIRDFYRLASVTDLKGGDPEEWPEDLRVRQFPVVTR